MAKGNFYPVVIIPKERFRHLLGESSLPEIFANIKRESAKRGLDYSPKLSFHTWFNESGDFCQQNYIEKIKEVKE
jgi:hypothetical protein